MSSVAKGAKRAVEKPGTILDTLSEARCATTVAMCPHPASMLAFPPELLQSFPSLPAVLRTTDIHSLDFHLLLQEVVPSWPPHEMP